MQETRETGNGFSTTALQKAVPIHVSGYLRLSLQQEEKSERL